MAAAYCLQEGDIRTGVTAVLRHSGELFLDKLLAAAVVLNGFGKSLRLMRIAGRGGSLHHSELGSARWWASHSPHPGPGPDRSRFQTVAEATQEEVLDALASAGTMIGRDDHTRRGLAEVLAARPRPA